MNDGRKNESEREKEKEKRWKEGVEESEMNPSKDFDGFPLSVPWNT